MIIVKYGRPICNGWYYRDQKVLRCRRQAKKIKRKLEIVGRELESNERRAISIGERGR